MSNVSVKKEHRLSVYGDADIYSDDYEDAKEPVYSGGLNFENGIFSMVFTRSSEYLFQMRKLEDLGHFRAIAGLINELCDTMEKELGEKVKS